MGNGEHRITLRSKSDDLELEIQADGISDLEQAYLDLLNAQTELKRVQQKHRNRSLVNELIDATSEYWSETEETRKMMLTPPLELCFLF
jgi:hypothetical protein